MFNRKKSPPATPQATLGPREVVTEATVVVEGFTREQVWGFIRPAQTALLTSEHTLRAFTVPGTGPGAGEEQCFVTLVNGKEHVSIIRVTDEQTAAFAEAITTNGEVPQRSRWEVESVDGGTRLTAQSWTDLPAGLTAAWVAEYQEAAQHGQDTYVRRVKTLIESGAVPITG